MTTRKDGWYWVKFYGTWSVCQYRSGKWLFDRLDEQPYTDASFEQIGDCLDPPDTI